MLNPNGKKLTKMKFVTHLFPISACCLHHVSIARSFSTSSRLPLCGAAGLALWSVRGQREIVWGQPWISCRQCSQGWSLVGSAERKEGEQRHQEATCFWRLQHGCFCCRSAHPPPSQYLAVRRVWSAASVQMAFVMIKTLRMPGGCFCCKSGDRTNLNSCWPMSGLHIKRFMYASVSRSAGMAEQVCIVQTCSAFPANP